MESTETTNEQQEFNVIETIEKIKDTQEFQTLLENQKKAYWESNIGNEVKNIYSNIDNTVKDVLGVDKPSDIKTSDWVKQNLAQLAETKKELEALKSKGNANEEQEKLWKAKFNKLQNELKEKEQQISSITQKGFENNISNKLDTYLVGKNFNSVYSESDLKDLVNLRKMRIIKNTKELPNGKIAVYNPDTNEPYLDTLGEPMSIEAVANEVFSSLYQAKKEGGNAPSDTPSAVTKGDVIAINMNSIKSKQDFFKEFQKVIAPKGLASHEEQYLKIQRATMEHYKINSLPLS
jgi:hypothetical protein